MRLFYISTNEVWGGSELLWYESAAGFLNMKYSVSIALKYNHKKIDAIRTKLVDYVNLHDRLEKLTLPKRFINKFFFVFKRQDHLLNSLKRFKPDIVIISQGNNIGSNDIMELCIQNNFRFVVLSQLVTELNWFWLDDALQKRLVSAYDSAIRCFFVSKGNLDLHRFLLAYDANNADIVCNPYSTGKKGFIEYPGTANGFRLAVVGRIECFHKGLDLLLLVLANEKWKSREISFNLYGTGPHVAIIQELLVRLNITNVLLHGFTSDITEIWSVNHALVQPSRMEGQSLSLLEALNLNRTAIVSKVGGAAEVIDNDITGFVANEATAAALDDALERAWARRFEWEQLGICAGNKIRSIMPKDPVLYFNKKIEEIIDGTENKASVDTTIN